MSHKISKKDFKNYSVEQQIATENGRKELVVLVWLEKGSIVYHVKSDNSNIIEVCNTLEKAIEAYNKL